MTAPKPDPLAEAARRLWDQCAAEAAANPHAWGAPIEGDPSIDPETGRISA